MHNLFLGELRHHCMDVWGLAGIGERRAAPKALAVQSPEEQKTQLNRVVKALKNFSYKMLKAIRRDYILAVAQYNKIALPDRPEKKDIADALLEQVRSLSPLIRIPLPNDVPVNIYVPPGFVSENEGSIHRRLFSSEVLDQIRKDIGKIVVPSWIEKPPSNFGSSMHGKLKADQWRTVCTIHMIITLVRLWGIASATDAERSVLNNFVQLVIAVDAATRRSMSPSRVTLFDDNMEAYVKGLRSIYKHTLVPNHHLSLHLRQCLLLFGPVRGWWSYPFERYNGLLQRLNTNHRTRDIPKTFMRYFYMGASLRWLLRSVKWPDSEVYQNWMTAFTSAFKDAARGTRYTDILSFLSASNDSYQYNEQRQAPIPRELYDQLYALIYPSSHSQRNQLRPAYDVVHGTTPVLPSAGHFVDSITRGGITYSSYEAGKRNCYVTFTMPHAGSTQEFAGRIKSILYHRRREGETLTIEPFIVIQQYSPLSPEHAKFDAFRTFHGLGTQLYYNKFEPQARVIRLSDVVAHVAVLAYTPEDIKKPCIVARSLNRVCAFRPFNSNVFVLNTLTQS
ncbi:hypothetical protein LXA43DRAFT_905901 [Ganoderma leucocontextum]|nr:hypothetical protein LXA43DRAFT_905901 [Ganoderma leucocontextum]